MKTKVNQLAKNQLIINEIGCTTFQSYDSIIAVKKDGKTFLDKKYWDYSYYRQI